MLRAAISFCVRQPVLTLLAFTAIAAIGAYCATVVPIDAIPNVGENQVIVFTEWPGRSPKDVEDQVTYPLSVALLTVPHAESVRGKSMFGYSFVQVTFAEFRSGAIDLSGTEAVGGIVVMRFGENPRAIIERVREKIHQIEPSLEGVKVVPVYDRTGLINETVATLTESSPHH